MNLKRNLIIFLSSISLSLTAQVKESVVIIKPEYHPEIIETFTTNADKFKENNQIKLSDTFNSFAEGGHGSGFVITGPDGNQYIVTNKHVLEYSDSLNIISENEDNLSKSISGSQIVYIDRIMDLALIKLKSNIFDNTFSFYNEDTSDGDEVWAAGYPGLLGEPAWQFSKGNITNSKASIPKLENHNLSYLIQHSASIDPGNSGGPLLIKDTESTIGYSVLGINTWSISNRNNTFFAIPSNDIVQFIYKAIENSKDFFSKEQMEMSLLSSVDRFISELNSDEPNQRLISSYISPNMIGLYGWDSYNYVLDISSSSLRTKWRDSFYYTSPIGTMRGAIYERLMSDQNDEYPAEFKKLLSLEKEETWVAETQLKMNNKKMKVKWVYNHGLWQIKDMNLNKFYLKNEDSITEKPKDNNISPAYANLAIPGLTQIQRGREDGFYYAIFGIGGIILILDSFLEFSGPKTQSNDMNEASSFRDMERNAGLTLYISSALLSTIFELLTD